MTELQLIRLIQEIAESYRVQGRQTGLPHGPGKGIGDDCALLPCSGDREILVTTDTMCQGIHFDLSYYTPEILGRRLAAVNLSDIAAMGGVPAYGFLNLEIPEAIFSGREGRDVFCPDRFWRLFIIGLCEELGRFGALLMGGDTVTTGCSSLSVTLTLIGEVEGGKALMRSGAQPGDLIFLSGPVGEADAGLILLQGIKGPVLRHHQYPSEGMASRKRVCMACPGHGARAKAYFPSRFRTAWKRLVSRHLLPEPRIRLGRLIAELGATSCIDLSDGMATDVAHIAQDSGCRLIIHEDRVPISRALRQMALQQGRGPFQRNWLRTRIFSGGEDFELLWTVHPDNVDRMIQGLQDGLGMKPWLVGEVQQGQGVQLKTISGKMVDISFKGYEHGRSFH